MLTQTDNEKAQISVCIQLEFNTPFTPVPLMFVVWQCITFIHTIYITKFNTLHTITRKTNLQRCCLSSVHLRFVGYLGSVQQVVNTTLPYYLRKFS